MNETQLQLQEGFEMLPANNTNALHSRTGRSERTHSVISYSQLLDPDNEESKKDSSSKEFTFGIQFIRRVRRIFSVLLSGYTDDRIGLYFALLLIGKLSSEVVYYYVGMLSSQFYKVLGDRDRSGFMGLLVKSLVLVVLAGGSKACIMFISRWLGVLMRNTLTAYTDDRYIKVRSFYILISQGIIDNPDQRITQDIRELSKNLATVFTELIVAPFLIAYYTVKCWLISGVFGPLSIYIYFIIGALVTRLTMPPVIRNVYLQEREEGNFRFHQVRIREFAESIAFYNGEDKERSVASNTLNSVITVQKRVTFKKFWVDFVTQLFSYLGASVSYIIISIPIFLGIYDDKSGSDLSSLISLNSFVSMYLIYRFTVVIEQARMITDIGGYTARITQLWEELDNLKATETKAISVNSGSGGISATDLSIVTPSGSLLISSLNLDIGHNESLIITGANGVGKTSLLRTLCGLWLPKHGELKLPHTESGALDIFFLPQIPYIVGGSLREQISYPGAWGDVVQVCGDDELRVLMRKAGLSHIIDRLNPDGYPVASIYDIPHPVQFWLKNLSPGEQQRISIARVLFWKPKFAVLDECTSSLDPKAEATLYEELVNSNITFISVSHRDSLLKYHQRQLHIVSGGYTLSNI